MIKPITTQREEAILDVIKQTIRHKGYPPSVREIGVAVGLSSSSTVHGYLRKLEMKGLLRRDPTKPRAIEVLDRTEKESIDFNILNIPIIGKVSAGSPVLAIENQEGNLQLPLDYTGAGNFFLLRVKGKSMIEAGIFEGDLVLVRQQPAAENGDIIVALLEENATVKRFFKEKEYIRLQPENKLLSPILVKEVQILGKVVGVIRKYY
ncbi:SOS-response transcriptional repressor, LexA [Desulfofarcimen acetoxidans DSM 771]|uniref:LexA repressor n=1 Tax=Desulfofarcimen acetoxidans (strain ATCC 49208 / DSM 771 / KCTC 5769 / VKM B-1644 / 5575) TaxID=485916 RepID=C8VZ52_DESAS|nr:SOS-response transcriptional repressor, LexA [Desulfofarcimen acetoxidans DSM 771]